MANNEDFDEANEGVPAADIPNLKKKEKERKKAGVAWTSGAKPGGAFSGAAGGTVARSAASAVGISGQAAAIGAVGGLFGLSTTAIAAGAGALLIGGAAAGYMMFGRASGSGVAAGAGDGNLGALASSLKIRGGGGDRTGYMASKGEIAFDDPAASAKIETEPGKEAAQGEAAAVKEDTSQPLPDWRQAGLAHNLSGSKLTSGLGESFGGKNIFAGGSGNPTPKLNNSIGKINIPGGQGGKLGSMRNGRTGRVSQGGTASHARAKNAFGQLKVAKGLSVMGAGATVSEGARSTAGAAFDGQAGAGNVNGMAPGMSSPDMGTSPNALGTGAPDMTAPNVGAPTGNAVMDPNVAAGLAAIGALAQQAGKMKKQGMMLLMIGLAMTATMFLMPIGLILVGMALAMIQMSGSMKNMADSMSQATAARTGNINQNAINEYCINKAYSDGSSTNNCNPPDSVTQGSKFDAATNPEVAKHREMVRVDGQVDDANGTPIAP
jgi:hypothetical protein